VGLASGPSTEVIETILHSRAPSTRKLYALKLKVLGVENTFRTQLTAQWVQCWNSCRSVSPQGYPPPY